VRYLKSIKDELLRAQCEKTKFKAMIEAALEKKAAEDRRLKAAEDNRIAGLVAAARAANDKNFVFENGIVILTPAKKRALVRGYPRFYDESQGNSQVAFPADVESLIDTLIPPTRNLFEMEMDYLSSSIRTHRTYKVPGLEGSDFSLSYYHGNHYGIGEAFKECVLKLGFKSKLEILYDVRAARGCRGADASAEAADTLVTEMMKRDDVPFSMESTLKDFESKQKSRDIEDIFRIVLRELLEADVPDGFYAKLEGDQGRIADLKNKIKNLDDIEYVKDHEYVKAQAHDDEEWMKKIRQYCSAIAKEYRYYWAEQSAEQKMLELVHIFKQYAVSFENHEEFRDDLEQEPYECDLYDDAQDEFDRLAVTVCGPQSRDARFQAFVVPFFVFLQNTDPELFVEFYPELTDTDIESLKAQDDDDDVDDEEVDEWIIKYCEAIKDKYRNYWAEQSEQKMLELVRIFKKHAMDPDMYENHEEFLRDLEDEPQESTLFTEAEDDFDRLSVTVCGSKSRDARLDAFLEPFFEFLRETSGDPRFVKQ